MTPKELHILFYMTSWKNVIILKKKKVFFQANVIYKESSKRIILLEELVNFKCQYGIVCKDKVQL